MFEELKKTLDKGMDYAFMTKDKIENAIRDFAKENNLNKEEAKKLLDQVIKVRPDAYDLLVAKAAEQNRQFKFLRQIALNLPKFPKKAH